MNLILPDLIKHIFIVLKDAKSYKPKFLCHALANYTVIRENQLLKQCLRTNLQYLASAQNKPKFL